MGKNQLPLGRRIALQLRRALGVQTALRRLDSLSEQVVAETELTNQLSSKLVARLDRQAQRHRSLESRLDALEESTKDALDRVDRLRQAEHQVLLAALREQLRATDQAREVAVATLSSQLSNQIAQSSESLRTALQEQTSGVHAALSNVAASTDTFRAVYLGNRRVLVRLRHLALFLIAEADDRIIIPHMIRDGLYEPDVTAFLLRNVSPGCNCVDVGANIGYHATMLGALSRPGGRVLAVEPDPDVFPLLQENININWLEATVKPVNVAAGDGSVETLRLNRVAFRSANTSIAQVPSTELVAGGQSAGQSFEATASSIDEIVEGSMDKVDLIKIDVEGAEALVLNGARQVIADNPHVKIVMEWSPEQFSRLNFTSREMLELFNSRGLTVLCLDHEGVTHPTSDAEMLGSPYRNIVLCGPDARVA